MTRRWWRKTTRSMAAEFGPPPGARYAVELSRYSDQELMTMATEDVVREVLAYRAAAARIIRQAHQEEVTR